MIIVMDIVTVKVMKASIDFQRPPSIIKNSQVSTTIARRNEERRGRIAETQVVRNTRNQKHKKSETQIGNTDGQSFNYF